MFKVGSKVIFENSLCEIVSMTDNIIKLKNLEYTSGSKLWKTVLLRRELVA